MTEKRNHRVLIQVVDQEIADDSLGTTSLRSKFSQPAAVYTARNAYSDVDVINNTTLSLSKKDSQNRSRTKEVMYFDCVARTECDPLIRNELSILFDILMIDQQSCCLIHFKPLRDGPSNFFTTILVPEIDRRIVLLRSTMILQSIKLEYYDVQKYDVVNMFQKARTIGSQHRKGTRSEMHFRNTRELLRWSQHAFVSLWASGSGHDSFELEFVFVDAPNELEGIPMGSKKMKIRLSILQFYMCQIDGNMRVGLQNFFEDINHNTPRTNQSIITDYLREYFRCKRSTWLIWMLFDIPQINYGGSFVNDMLTIAKSAFRGALGQKMFTTNVVDDALFSTSLEMSQMPRQVGGVNYPTSHKSQAFNKPLNVKVPCVKMDNYSLSFWYCQIEEIFSNIIAAMDKYYERKYELIVQKMCNDLKNTTRNIDKDLQSPNISFIDDNDIDEDETLKSHFKKYREVLNSFRILIQKIERTKYGEQLRVFINTKNTEITMQTRRMKIRLLELCQVRLSNAIKDEVEILKNDASLNSRLSGYVLKTSSRT